MAQLKNRCLENPVKLRLLKIHRPQHTDDKPLTPHSGPNNPPSDVVSDKTETVNKGEDPPSDVLSDKNETVNKGEDPHSAVTSDKNEPIKDRKKNKKAKLAAKELQKTNNNANCPATPGFEKPIKTLENSLINLQETTNDQQLQLNMFN